MTNTRTAPARYAAPPTPQALAARLGVPVTALCKLDANESPYGPPPGAVAALAAFAQDTSGLLGAGRYPEPAAGELRAALAAYTGVAAAQIVAGNGSDELIHLLTEALLEPGDEVVVSEPTFSLYALAARRQGATVVDTGRDANFSIAAERLAEAIGPRTRLVFLCAPNNPTGTPLPRATLLAALARAEALADHHGGPLVVVDEAYYEFGALADDPAAWTAAPLVAEGRRLVVLRTFSKLFGLAGLRVGYALCPPELAGLLRDRAQPYNVNSAGLVAAQAALDDLAWLRERAHALTRERERLAHALVTLGLRVHPSAANFLRVEIATGTAVAGETEARRDALWQRLLERGVLVRRFAGERLAAALRVTVGTPAQNDRLLAALSEALAAETRTGGAA